ncbi:MAG: UDP-N-acetylmuramate dehydrogenase [Planctomycetes bacterium]|nr:UDP-N-acetylmuramate dehydrogenase [Planctomycetota bacterium]
MSWSTEFADCVECDAPLGKLTWFRLGGPARYLSRPRSADELAAIMTRARNEGLETQVLGAGANVLVRDDGVDGVVVRLDQPGFREVEWDGLTARVGAGVDLMLFVRECSARGLSGLEGLAGIPGTIGGAVRMNAGTRHGEIGDVVRDVELLRRDNVRDTWTRDQLGFGYRRSALDGEIVLSARLEFSQGDPQQVNEAFVEHLAEKMRTQPLGAHSAGCVFKNPAGRSAGELIDRAGLKGTRCGGARVAREHANFIVADDGASASDVLRLIDLIRDRVAREFDVELELEVEVW